MNRVIIAGGRNINNYDLVVESVKESKFKINEIVCGEASGVDSLGRKYAEENNIPIKSFPANWNKFGKSAGYIRNKEMAKHSNHLILIWDGKSKGSGHMLDLAKQYGLEIYQKIVCPIRAE